MYFFCFQVDCPINGGLINRGACNPMYFFFQVDGPLTEGGYTEILCHACTVKLYKVLRSDLFEELSIHTLNALKS